ncbi:MAG: Tryptophan synthase beta chain [Candidatus Hinthialibacteria bacterium OLB16]|nr:MAG: Tryptophan synthase beta chain [Candidatus Hinthialibacteria bacterium OLB16]
MSSVEQSSYVAPDERGYFGDFGGRFIPETLMGALKELEAAYTEARRDSEFQKEVSDLLKHYAGRETPLFEAKRLSRHYGTGRIVLKREDLLHTGAHKINNTIGQGLLARRMGKSRIIAETGAGQHGVATATVAALMGLECVVYMGREDIERQRLNVFRMNMLGAKIQPVYSGSQTLKDATNEAIRDWVTHVRNTHYIIGSAIGPHPYPMMVRDFQSVIGSETRRECLERYGRLPSHVLACIGGGSNGMGMFHPFLDDAEVQLIGIEAAGLGLETGKHSASLTLGTAGVFHGSMIKLLQEHEGQIKLAHSVSAGLDYPGVGPEHCHLHQTGRAKYVSVTDQEALDAFQRLSQLEGILPALESSHAIAYLETLMPSLSGDSLVVLCLSGRGDKDVYTVAHEIGYELKV